jgi:hypothetical protein
MMDTFVLFVRVAFLGMALGFGFRMGWRLLPIIEEAMTYVISVPIWLCQLVAFHWRRAHRNQ